MKIAVVETTGYGGLLHYAVQLGDGLARRGHDVDLLTARGNELAGREGAARMRDILLAPVPSSAAPPAHALTRLARRGLVALRLTAAWARVVWESARGGYDVVLINATLHRSVGAAGALAVTLIPGGPHVANIAHNVMPLDRGSVEGTEPSRLLAWLLRTGVKRMDLVFVHGERSRKQFKASWPPVRLAIIPHGDEGVFGEPPSPSGEARVLFFGDWNRAKGLPVLMQAFDLLAERRPDARLTIAGTPYPHEVDVDEIKGWAERQGDRVEVIDAYVPIDDVPAVFGRARVVAIPYVAGYQSGVVHLAMTLGRAVVASDVGDLASVVRDGQTGLVVPPGDADALAGALERVLADPELAQRFGEAARRLVIEHSGWDRVAELAENALESAVGGGTEAVARAGAG